MAKGKLLLSVSDLLRDGKENGFVTQDDILSLFPKPEDKIPELDDLYKEDDEYLYEEHIHYNILHILILGMYISGKLTFF